MKSRIAEYLYWSLGPVERALAERGVTARALTLSGLGLSVIAGILAAGEAFAWAGVIYLAGGILDVLDGRIARRSGSASAAGALLDSVCDRWGEFVVLGGIAFAVRAHPIALGAVLVTIAGSQMVSYTRARAEGLGVRLAVGLMQRSERVVLVGLGLVVAGAVSSFGIAVQRDVLAAVLVPVGLMSMVTAIRRFLIGAEALSTRGRHAAREKRA